jgi:hypothetical protein
MSESALSSEAADLIRYARLLLPFLKTQEHFSVAPSVR